MKPFFGTTSDVAMITTAGSGGLEAAIVNTLSPGDRVLGVSIGSFGDRFAKIAGIYGADVTKLDAEWGYAAAADEIRERLRSMPDAKAVLLTHNETSTGVMNPIAELAAAIREETPEALILVDSVSGLGAVPFQMDDWGVDVVVTGSQKAWMSAPGLAMIAASTRGWAAMETASMPRFYLDLRAHRDAAATGQTPFTPAIAVVYQVDEGLRLMAEEGAESIFARHEACAAAARAGLAALGFELFADPRHASKTVTAANVPDDLDWKAFNSEVKRRGLVLAGGQGKLTGKIFRLGHLGSVTLEEILGALGTLEFVGPGQRPHRHPGRGGRRRAARGARVVRGRRRNTCRGRRMRVLVAEAVAQEGIDLLAAAHEVDERIGCTREELAALLPDYDALIVRSQVQVDAELIAAGQRLVVIGRAGVGVDNVDLEAATRAGITVVNAPTGNTIAAAEHTLALLYGVARRTAAADASVRRGEWKRAQFTGLELRGRTLGIVGLGKIGQAIADRARAMEMVVLGVDPYVSAEQAANHGVELVDFDTMLSRADIVTVHVPLTRATRGLIGKAAIAKLKPGAIVLNVARGGIVDEAAVADALASGHLAGRGDRRLRRRAADRLAPAGGPEHAADAAPRRVDGRGPGPRGRGGRGPGARRARGSQRTLRRQRPAAHPGDRPGDRPVPATRRGPRAVLRPVLARWREDADPRDRRGAGRARRHAPDRCRAARAARDRHDRAGEPRQRRCPGQGAGHDRGRAQDPRRRARSRRS